MNRQWCFLQDTKKLMGYISREPGENCLLIVYWLIWANPKASRFITLKTMQVSCIQQSTSTPWKS